VKYCIIVAMILRLGRGAALKLVSHRHANSWCFLNLTQSQETNWKYSCLTTVYWK